MIFHPAHNVHRYVLSQSRSDAISIVCLHTLISIFIPLGAAFISSKTINMMRFYFFFSSSSTLSLVCSAAWLLLAAEASPLLRETCFTFLPAHTNFSHFNFHNNLGVECAPPGPAAQLASTRECRFRKRVSVMRHGGIYIVKLLSAPTTPLTFNPNSDIPLSHDEDP